MITPTIQSLDGTGNPAADGCKALYNTAWSEHDAYGDVYTDDVEYFRLEATEAEGWVFDHFSYTQNTWYYGVLRQTQKYDQTANPYPAEDTPHRRNNWYYLFEETFIQEGVLAVESRIVECVAVFRKQSKSSITVNTSASPDEGGTTTPESETREGNVGQSETFTLVATPEDGYEFKRWEDGDGALVSKSKTTSVTKTYTKDPQTFDYTAIFRKFTGLILRNDSGTILHGSSGAILRDE